MKIHIIYNNGFMINYPVALLRGINSFLIDFLTKQSLGYSSHSAK